MRDALAALGGRPNDLVPYPEVRRRVSPEGETDRGQQPVPLDRIAGSTDRNRDFDREFMPRRRSPAARWRSIDRADNEGRDLPPVALYRVGDVYVVRDGHHRVSVARDRGEELIDAEVTDVHLRAPLRPSMTLGELLLQTEYAEFLRRTDLDRLRPDHGPRPTDLGAYDEIWGHIQAHRRWLGDEFEGRPVGLEEAVARWYDRVYGPIVRLAREWGIRRRFPGRTEADLYLWLMRHGDELYDRYRRTRELYASAAEHVAAMRARLGPRAGLAAGVGCLRRPRGTRPRPGGRAPPGERGDPPIRPAGPTSPRPERRAASSIAPKGASIPRPGRRTPAATWPWWTDWGPSAASPCCRGAGRSREASTGGRARPPGAGSRTSARDGGGIALRRRRLPDAPPCRLAPAPGQEPNGP